MATSGRSPKPALSKLSYPGGNLARMHADVERAVRPESLSRLILERLNAGDVDGLTALYEPNAVLALPDGEIATGSDEIRRAYERLVADRPMFEPGIQQPTLLSGDLALTSTRLPNGAVTVEVARRQADGTWLWVIDQPNVVS
jgi:ketosteroid isomerase-like protein